MSFCFMMLPLFDYYLKQYLKLLDLLSSKAIQFSEILLWTVTCLKGIKNITSYILSYQFLLLCM